MQVSFNFFSELVLVDSEGEIIVHIYVIEYISTYIYIQVICVYIYVYAYIYNTHVHIYI